MKFHEPELFVEKDTNNVWVLNYPDKKIYKVKNYLNGWYVHDGSALAKLLLFSEFRNRINESWYIKNVIYNYNYHYHTFWLYRYHDSFSCKEEIEINLTLCTEKHNHNCAVYEVVKYAESMSVCNKPDLPEQPEPKVISVEERLTNLEYQIDKLFKAIESIKL